MSNQTNKMRGETDFNSDEVLPWPFHTLKLFKFYEALSLQQLVRNLMQKQFTKAFTITKGNKVHGWSLNISKTHRHKASHTIRWEKWIMGIEVRT